MTILKTRTRVVAALALIASTLVASATAPFAPIAAAQGSDDFTLTKVDNVEGEALIGEHVTYTIEATGDQASGAYLYNLSFRDVLPAGVSFVSADPAPTEVLVGVPAGQTTVIWENVSDLPSGSFSSVDVTVDTNPDFAGGTSGFDTVPVGSSITNNAEAVASDDAFTIPDWDESTGAFTGDFTGSGSASQTVDIVALRVTKRGPDELLRGVHAAGVGGAAGGTEGEFWTIEVEANPDYDIDAVSLVDVLHAGLEFLGCDTYIPPDASPWADNTSVGDEWTGSGPVATGTGCSPQPVSIDTLGTGATEVSWDLGDIAANTSSIVTYQAGIPLFANEPFASGPTAASLRQGRNLDNNTGPSTGEGDSAPGSDPELLAGGEQTFDNTALASGTYTPTGGTESDDDIELTQSEDLIIDKTSSGSLIQGSTVVSTLTISASEYRDFSNLVVRDLLPSALCFMGTYNADITPGGSDWATNDCPGAGSIASTVNGVPVPATSVRELPDGGPYGTGRMEIVWSHTDLAALAALESDGQITITYSAVVREDYRSGLARDTAEPVLSGDSVTNRAEVSGPDVVAGAGLPADPADADGGVDGDTASADLENGLASIDKRIAEKTGPVADGSAVTGATCATEHSSITWVDGSPTVAGYGPGDIVCFELGASFPANVDYEGVTIQDLLPPGYAYITGSATRIAGIDTLSATTVTESPSIVTFTVASGGDVEADGNEFRWVIAATVGPVDEGAALDINANLQKMVWNNNGGRVFQLRDETPAEWAEPQLRLAKGVAAVDSTDDGIDLGPLGADHDGSLGGGSTAVPVQANTLVGFRVDVWNTGNVDALNAEVQDVLPDELTCADVAPASISNGGTCTSGVITWSGLPDVPASVGGGDVTPDDQNTAPLTLTYDVVVPADITPNLTMENTAGVASYEADTNTGTTSYYPADNIDPANSALENTDAANDPAFLETGAPGVAKVQQSGIDEAGNSQLGSAGTGDEQLTIGEIVEYTITATVPEGVTVFDAEIRDALPTGLTYFEGSALFDGSVQTLAPSVVSTDTAGSGADLDSGTLVTPALGSNGTVRYELPDPYDNEVGDAADVVVITFYAQVDDIPANEADPSATRFRNSASFRWDDAGGSLEPQITSPSVDAYVVEPNPQVVKTHTSPAGANVSPGDTVTYRLTITNPTTATNVSVAHDLDLVDTVPVGASPLGPGGVPVSANGDLVPSTGTTPAGAFTGTWSESARTITWDRTDWAELESVDPGDTLVFTYDVQIDDPAVASGVLVNTADLTGHNLDQDIDPNAADGRSATDSDFDAVMLPVASMAKDIEPFNSADPDDDIATLTVGEPVLYQVTSTIPTDTVVYDAVLFDDLPPELDFDSFGGISVSSGCEIFDAGTGSSSGTSLEPSDVDTFNPAGGDPSVAAWFIGDVFANGACEITVTYAVHVNSSAVDADAVTNDALLVWNTVDEVADQDPTDLPADYGSPSDDWDATDGPDSETFTVVEPALELDKDVTELDGSALTDPTCDTTPGNNTSISDDADGLAADGCDVEAGAEVRYTVTVASVGTSDAHDIVAVDTVPVGVNPLSAPGGSPVTTTGQTVTGSTGSTGTWDADDRTITWTTVGPLAPTAAVTHDYDARLAASDDLVDAQDLPNTVTIDEFYGLSSATRTAIVVVNPANDDIPLYGSDPLADRAGPSDDVVVIEVHFPDLVIDKTEATGQDVTDVRLNAPFTWELTVTNDDTVASAFNVDITDVLPAGWTYVTGSATVTTPHGAATIDPVCAASFGSCNDAATRNVETLTWIDAVAGVGEPLAPGEEITISFDAVPQSAALSDPAYTGYDSGAGFEHLNTASTTGEDASGSDSCCDPDGPGGADPVLYGDTDDDGVFIRRVDLSVDKAISPLEDDADAANGPYWFGSFVNYTITVDNDGPDAATNVTVDDILDPTELGFDSVVSVDRGTFDEVTNVWDVGSLGAGDSLELVLRVRLLDLGSVTNIAQVETADQYDDDSTPGNDVGAEDDQDEVTIEVVPTSLGDYVWLDLNGDGVQDGTEPGIPDVAIIITWLDPGDGSLQTYLTTTNAAGSYGVPPAAGLPADTDITVTIDVANSPNLTGLVPSYDRDGGLDDRGTDQITASDTAVPDGSLADLDYDFGYTPGATQSIGDIVWWDQDGSGDASNGAGETPLAGIDVTAEWAGFDGVFGTGDEIVFTDTTDGSGLYLFDTIPPGEYRITVDDADLPAGLDTPTYDLDGTASPHVTDVTLAAGDDRRDVDFSYGSSGSIGDTVWLDLDGDGDVDPGEPGIPGVEVTVTWAGPDGVLGTGDDVDIVTETDATGAYAVNGLPFGDYEVTVDPSDLPPDIVQTFDDDGLATPHTSTATLDATSPVDLDQDFGYRGLGDIGDTIWLDRNGNGGPLVDGTDVGIPGVDITLTLTNPNGGPDIVFTTTTDTDGTYLFPNLPDGDYTITIDPDSLPAGVAPVFDADGGGDLTSTTTLDDDPLTVAIESQDLDQDFSFAGDGSIGDTLWHDLDGDGEIDPGEPGLGGVDVAITYTDPGTGLTFTETLTTDPDGTYRFEDLPEGDYTVRVDPDTLPDGMAPTYDLDGTLDDDATVTLGAGEDRDDVDFGYQLTADLRIDKSHVGDFVIGVENTWTLTVTNDGPAAAVAPVVISDDLPLGTTFVDSAGDDWDCDVASRFVSCTYVDSTGTAIDMPDATVSAVDLIVLVDASAAPSVTNTAVVDSDTPGDPRENNSDDDTAEVPLSILELDKRLDDDQLTVGDEATYVLTVVNTGPSPTRSTITITDDLPASLVHVSTMSPTDVDCVHVDGVVTCTTDRELAVDDSVTVELVVRVSPTSAQSIVNNATVDGGNELSIPPGVLDDLNDDGGAVLQDSESAEVRSQTLPFTGARVFGLLVFGLVAIAVGVGLRAISRRFQQPIEAS